MAMEYPGGHSTRPHLRGLVSSTQSWFFFIFLTFSSCYTPLCSCFWQQRRLLLLSSPVCFTDVSMPDGAAIASPRSTHTPAPPWLQDQLCSTMQPCWLLSGHADMVGLKTRELWVHFNSFSHAPNSQLLGPEKEMISWKSRCKSSNCSSGCSKSRGCAMDESSAPSRQNKSYHAAKEKMSINWVHSPKVICKQEFDKSGIPCFCHPASWMSIKVSLIKQTAVYSDEFVSRFWYFLHPRTKAASKHCLKEPNCWKIILRWRDSALFSKVLTNWGHLSLQSWQER